ncbi:MAG: type VI secretion system-associated FHA domain protein TagH [Gemmobacter sp.]
MPVTLRFQSTGAVPGDGAPIVMRGPSLTIGRGAENDIVLPDPDRLISKNHCAIEDQNGNVVVIDFSTNGTFLNYGKVPLGRVPTPLNDGDVLTLGGYEMIVAISSGRPDPRHDLAAPVDDLPVSHGRAEDAPDLMDLLDGAGSKRTDFLDDLMGAAPLQGPSGVVREDPIDELGLPAMAGEDDPILGRIPDPIDDFVGASARHHSPSVSDGFSLGARKAGVIPDDWDDDLLSPAPKAGQPRDPFAAGASVVPPPPSRQPRAVPDLPPDAFEGLMPGQSIVPKPPRARAAPDAVQAEGESPFAAPVPNARSSVVPPPPPARTPQSAPPPPAAVAPRPQPAVAPAPPPRAAAAAAGSERVDAGRAFFRGAGAEDVHIPDADLAATMERLGGVVKTMIEGLRAVLMTRAEIKSEFRVERTQISAGGNNPLKFALSPDHAVEMILRPKAKGYMDASAAVREALDDIQAHEMAMVTGIQAAIRELLGRLDPKAMEEKAGSGGGLSGMMSNRKAKLWDEYERSYADLADKAQNDFHDFFAKAFSRAYQDQLEKLKQERKRSK